MSNAPVIRATNLTKRYRLFAKPRDRFLDAIGFSRPVTYRVAVNEVDLEIHKGERVGLVGRNGSGKSTLLKLISGSLKPTSGVVETTGRMKALLQIGVGFHGEMTGRENARAYLEQMGLGGPEAEKLAADAIEFAELESYADQPMRTYSTGMAARIVFAASTVVAPDVLILDEILGVGDAYFSRKSLGRIRELCTREGTTAIIVSHDIYAVSSLATRIIWLDRGQIVMDGAPEAIVSAYEESVRLQEEERIRLKLARASTAVDAGRTRLILEVRSATGQPFPADIAFRRLALRRAERVVAEVPLSEEVETSGRGVFRESCAWGDFAQGPRGVERPLRSHGSVHYRGLAAVDVEAGEEVTNLGFALSGQVGAPVDVQVRLFDGVTCVRAANLRLGPGAFDTATDGSAPTPADVESIRTEVMGSSPAFSKPTFGNARVIVKDVRFCDAEGRTTLTVAYGENASAALDLEFRDTAFEDSFDVCVSLYRPDSQYAVRIIGTTPILRGDPSRQTIRAGLGPWALGEGIYSLAVQVAKAGYYSRPSEKFFSLNEDVYYVARLGEIRVTSRASASQGSAWVHRTDWVQDKGGSV